MSESPDLPPPLPTPTAPSNPLIIPGCIAAYALLLVVAFGLLRSDWSMPVGAEISMSPKRATFFVASSATLTGFQTTVTVESLRPTGQITVLVLMLAGAVLSWFVGGLLVARALRLPIGARSILIAIFALLLIALLVGAISATPGGLFASVFGSISALTNSGLWIGPAPESTSRFTLQALLPLSIVGGIGVTVLIELFRSPMTRSLSAHAKSTIGLWAVFYVVGVLAIFLSDWLCGIVTASSWREQFAAASALSINTRSAGLATELLNTLERPTQWIAAVLMLVGGGSGGAAGGMKVTTIAILIAGVSRVFRGDRPSRVFGIAIVWVASYLLLVAMTFWWLLGLTPEQSADRLLMLAISAVGNVGLSHDVTSASGYDAYVLSVAMLTGRILPLAVLAWVAADVERSDVVVG